MAETRRAEARADAGRQAAYAALALHMDDNVATAVRDLAAGTDVSVMWPDDETREVTVRQDIPFGHKFALEEMAAGAEVRKYGERIGKTRERIAKGAHVHVHNVESERGRGDLAAGESQGTDGQGPALQEEEQS